MQDKDFKIYMNEAVRLAEIAASMSEVPVGAVIVNNKNGEITGRGFNRRETDRSPLAHAEIIAIEEASRTMNGWRLVDSTIFVTLEPCPMCSGAIINARLDRLVFGAFDKKGGAVESVQKMFELPYNYRPEVISGFMEEECSQLLKDFFRELRLKKKNNKIDL